MAPKTAKKPTKAPKAKPARGGTPRRGAKATATAKKPAPKAPTVQKPESVNRKTVQKAESVNQRTAGRPPLHTPELAAAVCQGLMEGLSLRRVCERPGMPSRDTVLRWLHDDTGGFCAQYARAREAQAEIFGEETLDIADEDQEAMKPILWRKDRETGEKVPVMVAFDKTAISRNRLRIQARQWYAAQMAPKRFGKIMGVGDGEGVAGVMVLVKDMTGRKD